MCIDDDAESNRPKIDNYSFIRIFLFIQKLSTIVSITHCLYFLHELFVSRTHNTSKQCTTAHGFSSYTQTVINKMRRTTNRYYFRHRSIFTTNTNNSRVSPRHFICRCSFCFFFLVRAVLFLFFLFYPSSAVSFVASMDK